MDPVIAMAVGGIVGSALKAFVTNSQHTLSRQSIADILIGGAVGILYPLFPLIELPATASPLQKAAMIGVLAYFSSDLTANIATKLGLKKPTPPAP